MRQLLTVNPKDAERFAAKVDSNGPVPEHVPHLGPCWVWMASTKNKGYGQFVFGKGGTPGFEVHRAHRVAWVLATGGPVPDGMCVLHRCDNPSCVRPSHLFLGTVIDNDRDMREKRREARISGDAHWSRQKPERLARKLSAEQIEEIRRLRGLGVRLKKLAIRFEVSMSAIWRCTQ